MEVILDETAGIEAAGRTRDVSRRRTTYYTTLNICWEEANEISNEARKNYDGGNLHRSETVKKRRRMCCGQDGLL